MFRVGKLTTGDHPIWVTNVHIADNKNKLLFVLRSSKTHGLYAKPQMVKITATDITKPNSKNNKAHNRGAKNKTLKNWSCCPYQLLRNYLHVRPKYLSIREPFFVFSDGTPIKPRHMRKTLKKILKMCGFNHNLYNTHSWRSGRLVDLLKLGVSVSSIKILGRWHSNAVFTYLSNL